MAEYKCSICGYIYDEEKGIEEAGIAPGTRWEDLPHNWVCPLCGATKDDFQKQGEPAVLKAQSHSLTPDGDMREMSAIEISALCSNLARGCEKQYKAEEAAHFTKLADYFKAAAAPVESADISQLLALIDKDLSEGFANANAVSEKNKDRGALRALVWSEKVTRILKSLLTRYQKLGDAMLQNTSVYVCTICGFVYIGDAPPELCPVCKVPNWKFEKVEGR